MTTVVTTNDIEAFLDGRQFRTFYEFSIPTGQSVILRYTAITDFILTLQDLTVDAGGIRFSAIGSGTTGGSWTPISMIGKNRMASLPQPNYAAKNVLEVGGTVTGGNVVEIFRVVTSGATAQQVTVGGRVNEPRGLPANVYHLKLENISNTTATGVYALAFQEMPLQTYRRG